MSLFNSIEINPNIIPFIEKGEGVGIVKVEGIGKCSARLESDKIILNSYESPQNSQAIPLADINFLSYDEGNFINEPKFNIGVSGKQFILAGVDNNDNELKRFYTTILNIKENQRQPRPNPNHNNGMPRPNPNITNPNKQPHNPMDFNSTNAQPNDMLNNNDFMEDVTVDPVDEIRRYYELKQDGIITEEEFEKKKKQLLGI